LTRTFIFLPCHSFTSLRIACGQVSSVQMTSNQMLGQLFLPGLCN